MDHHHFYHLGGSMFALGLVFLVGGIVLLGLGGDSASLNFMMLSSPCVFLGVLAVWTGRALKEQADRIRKLEERPALTDQPFTPTSGTSE
jgi:hypothetical protein